MKISIRPPDDVYWHFRRLSVKSQVGAECQSQEDGYLYRLREDRVIVRIIDSSEIETIDSIPLKLPPAAKVLTGAGWGFRMPISCFYQRVIAQPFNQPEKQRTF